MFFRRVFLLLFIQAAAVFGQVTDDEGFSVQDILNNDAALDALLNDEPAPSERPAPTQPKTPPPPPPEGKEEPEADAPTWFWEVELGSGLGYKKNVLSAFANEQDSAFLESTLEATFFRLAKSRQTKVFGYLLAENGHYFDVPELSDEWLVAALAQAQRPIGDTHKVGLGLQYTYFQQAFDLGFLDLIGDSEPLGATVIRLHQAKVTPHWETDLPGPFRVRLETPVAWNRFQDRAQDYVDYGVGLTLGYDYGHGSKWEATVRYDWRNYRDREYRDRLGSPVPDTSLEWNQYEVELEWEHVFDKAKTTSFSTTARLRKIEDNGLGYHDFWMYRLNEELRYEKDGWLLSVGGSYSHYDYPVQTVEDAGRNHRHRSVLALFATVEKDLGKRWRAFADCRFEHNLGNERQERYDVQQAQIGLRFRF